MYIIGIVGKSGSGKSFFAKHLAKHFKDNCLLIEMDTIGHQVVAEDKDVIQTLISYFGDSILDDHHMIDRKKLSNLVFSNKTALNFLNMATWPAMDKLIQTMIQESKKDFIILDYALLPATKKYFDCCDYKVLIESPIELRMDHLRKREDISVEKFQKREEESLTYNPNDYDLVFQNISYNTNFLSNILGIYTLATFQNNHKKIAYYPGSFDPITYGHMDIINKALKIGYDEVIIAVTANSAKKTMFTLEERYQMITKLYESNFKVKVIKVTDKKASVKVAEEYHCNAMIRGFRNVSDYEYELNLSKVNASISNVATLFINASHQYDFVSSSATRELANLGEDISFYVPPLIENIVYQKLGKNKN